MADMNLSGTVNPVQTMSGRLNVVPSSSQNITVDDTLTQTGQAADAAVVGSRLSALSEEKVNKSALSLGFSTDGKLYIMVSGVPIGSGVEINGTIDPSEGVVVFTADFSGLAPSAAQFYSWEGRIYDNAIYDALQNIKCTDGVAVLTSVYDSANSRWIKQMMCTGGLFESDNFICSFKAKFSGLAGSWNNVITYGTGTHWTNGIYSDGVKWPAGGEIDAFEQAGGYKETPNTMNTTTVHYGSGTESGYPNTHEHRGTGTVEFTTDEWHDFKFSLKNGYVKIWIDEVLVGENDFSDCSVSNNYLIDYKPFLKPQAFYIDGSCASESATSNLYEFEVSDFKIYQDENVTCTGLEIFPQMWNKGTSLVFPTGAELYLDRDYTPENTSNKACTWVSSDEKVATVVQGFVKTIAEGSAVITATCGAISATYDLTVSNSGTNIPCAKLATDSDAGIIVGSGSSANITTYIYPRFATEAVTWSTSDSTVATVEDGTITGLSSGTAIITAICGGNTAEIPVTVVDAKTPYLAYDFTPLYKNINTLVSDENRTVSLQNSGSFGDAGNLELNAVTQAYYNDGTYEPNGVVVNYGNVSTYSSMALSIALSGSPFLMLYKGVDYSKKSYTRSSSVAQIIPNGRNSNVMPSIAGNTSSPGNYYVRYGGASASAIDANGTTKNIVVYSDGSKSWLYVNGEKIINNGSIGYIASSLTSLYLAGIDEQIEGMELYVGDTFTEDELLSMSTYE